MRFCVTRRGRVVLAAVLLAVTGGWLFGARSLNAVATPLAAAFLLAVIWGWRSELPEVDIGTVEPGVPGARRTLLLSVPGSAATTVTVELPEGVVEDRKTATAGPGRPARIEVELAARGVYRLGPIRVRRRDPLGLIEREGTTDGTELVVYPELYELSGWTALDELLGEGFATERQEFERLREYTPGDALRRIHWPTSAKYGEFVVAEHTGDRTPERITIAAGADQNGGETLARTASTLSQLALDAGLEVGLAIPGEWIEPDRGETHERELRRAIADVDPGPVPPRVVEEADVAIHVESSAGTATPESTTIEVGGEERKLSSVLSRSEPTRRVIR